MRAARVAWLGLMVALLSGGLPAGATSVETFTATYALPAGAAVSVANVQGSIAVEAWDRAAVELTVNKSTEGERAALADVEIEVRSDTDGFHVQTIYPGEMEEAVAVDYRLRVPRQARLEELRTVNGNIEVRNVEGAVEARTLNGHIEGTGLAGNVSARSVNGSVSVALRALPETGGTVQVETINGDLQLLLPSSADVDLELSTVAGRIETTFLLEARYVLGDTSVRARLGRGSVSARMRTVRGNIFLGRYEDLL
jgi:hypothetical protein